MIQTVVNIDEISFEKKDPGILLESIRQRGMAIAVQVNKTDSGYICVDGHKRLSACALLRKENPKFEKISVVLMNDYSKAGSAFWGNTQNHH